jgi:uncharacterized membrane protein
VTARTRLIVAAAAGVVGLAASIPLVAWQTSLLIGWNAMGTVFAGLVWFRILGMDGETTRRFATIEDESRTASDLVLICACLASLIGVGLTLVKAGQTTGADRAFTISVALLSVTLAWLAVHTVFTLRYAHLFYLSGGGIDFHDERDPAYTDFAYVGFTIGMTFQVSDTDITSKPIRRAALRHALLSFVFGTAVLALTVNVVAGLLR